MNYTIEFYRNFLINTGIQYLCPHEVLSLTTREKEAYQIQDQDWYLRAARKVNAISQQKPQVKHELNTKARELGRKGEQLAVQALKDKGWKIITKPNKSLRPRFGNSTQSYDIIATWGNNEPRHIEVKTLRDNASFITLNYRFKWRFENNVIQQKYKNHYIAFVWRNEIYYVRSKNLKFITGIPNCNYPEYNFAWVVDPTCLKKIEQGDK